MPRRNHPRKRRGRGPASAQDEEESDRLRAPDIARAAPEGWHVRLIQPSATTKEYRCPGCNQEIRRTTKHVVVWREGAEDWRRHWHAPCWKRAAGGSSMR